MNLDIIYVQVRERKTNVPHSTRVRFRAFPDHHRYDRSDVKSLQQWTTEAPQVDAVLCTHKDLVKISLSQLGDLPLRALTIGVEILEGQEAMESKLLEILERMTSN